MQPIVDICNVAFDADGWRTYLMRFACETPGYLRFFGRSLAASAGIEPESFEAAFARSPAQAVDVLVEGGGLATSLDDHVRSLRAQGVRHQVLQGGFAGSFDGVDLNARVAGWAVKEPDLLQAWAGLSLRDPIGSVSELDRCVGELGMRGAVVAPFWDDVDAASSAAHTVYGHAEELGIPIWLHTGMTHAANRPLSLSGWDHVDGIASAHPDLVLIAGHGGWPRILDGVAVLQRHPNVYLDISAHRPRYMNACGSGWESLLHYGRRVVRDKVLFGSVEWTQQLDVRQLADEVHLLGLGDEATSAWLYENGARLLQLGGAR